MHRSLHSTKLVELQIPSIGRRPCRPGRFSRWYSFRFNWKLMRNNDPFEDEYIRPAIYTCYIVAPRKHVPEEINSSNLWFFHGYLTAYVGMNVNTNVVKSHHCVGSRIGFVEFDIVKSIIILRTVHSYCCW